MIRAIGLVLMGALASPAAAQPTRPDQPARERHLLFSEGEAADRSVMLDGILSESRTGNRPAEFSLDLCFPQRPDLTSLDRVTAQVAVTRNRMTATGRSLVAGLPTTVTIETAPGQGKGAPSFKGTIVYGDQTIAIREQPLEFEDGAAPEPYQPSGVVGTLAPNEAMATVPLGSVRAVLDIARQQKAVLPPNQLVPGCADLRTGKQIIRLVSSRADVRPLLSALKAIPGSEVTGPEHYAREDGVRLPANLRSLPEIRIVQDFAETARKVLGASEPAAIRSRPENGDHVILVPRDTALAKPLGLREVVVITVMIAPEIGSEKGDPMLYLMRVGSGFLDPAESLTLQQDLTESASYTDIIPGRVSGALADAFAARLGTEARQGAARR
ncbi:hypothetical protein [Enterovirga rhinocerotis]|uniref:Uncharacterized protein n=1 Tax=Enterovirga rhinocerotis TaxID=1339210 RepID=A0A4R7C6Y8_9HYPH|nr:hypothetical protein [Enterovirga rhinocerotis]TDR93005.1 hypothetical protein EV668_0252 [Enterovirga rhinocerotis]